MSLQPEIPHEAVDKYDSLISDLNLEFENRFQDFKKHHVLFSEFAMPFAVDVNLLPGRLQMEHCEMCCDTQLKEKFNQIGLEEFYKTYLDKDKILRCTNMFCLWSRYLKILMRVNSFLVA